MNGCASSSSVGLGVGNLAPDFQLKDTEGQVVSLSNLRSSPVILNFWASWCGPCQNEMPFLQQIYEDWQDKGVILVTINLREAQSVVTKFIQDNNLSFPVLLDLDGSVTLDYNVSGIPTTFFIDGSGIIQAKKLGPFTSIDEIESSISKIQ